MTESLGFFLDSLSMGFMQNALFAALFSAVACGVIGSLVVVNRLVFLAGGVAHTAYGGVGLAFFLGTPVLPTTVGFTLAGSLAMGALTLTHRERSDTVIGVLWASGMALGVILLDLTPGYNVDLMSYLFGSILAVGTDDLYLMAGLNLIILVLVFFFYKDFLALSFDREFASARGAPVAFLHFLLLGLVALTVVMIIRVVGLILVIALVSIPPSLAGRHSSSLRAMMFFAVMWSLAFCLLGLFFSFVFNISSGAAIIAVAAMAYFLVISLGWLLRTLFRPHHQEEP
ncbi:MAG: metal ABC transporter permease [Desulfovibrio sp.]|nr:MAG: metal ABC transporter permease [Desulfovibrio sp.]